METQQRRMKSLSGLRWRNGNHNDKMNVMEGGQTHLSDGQLD